MSDTPEHPSPIVDPDELASSYLDGELSDGERARVEADPALLALVETHRVARDALASPVEPMGAEQRDAVHAAASALEGRWLEAAEGFRDAWRRFRDLGTDVALAISQLDALAVGPLDDPMLRSMFEVMKVPQITNIQFWRGVGGQTTSERGTDSAEAHLRAIRDDHGRIMVLMTHNTDISDSWEREGQNPEYFLSFSPPGYAVGLNVALYAMMR